MCLAADGEDSGTQFEGQGSATQYDESATEYGESDPSHEVPWQDYSDWSQCGNALKLLLAHL